MLATYFPKFPLCFQCKQEITKLPAHYVDGAWSHDYCHEKALAQFHEATRLADEARAEKQAERFGFAPFVLTGVSLLDNWQGNPSFWHQTG